jgi:hypothetical protein
MMAALSRALSTRLTHLSTLAPGDGSSPSVSLLLLLLLLLSGHDGCAVLSEGPVSAPETLHFCTVLYVSHSH